MEEAEPVPSQLDPKQIRDQMEKILSTGTFRNAPAVTSFLRFVIEETLAGRAIKEYTIATEVLGRPTDFEAGADSAVRSIARHLRTKLHEYYASEGQTDVIRINIPKGGYDPVFERNTANIVLEDEKTPREEASSDKTVGTEVAGTRKADNERDLLAISSEPTIHVGELDLQAQFLPRTL
jgi:hypothetical protein